MKTIALLTALAVLSLSACDNPISQSDQKMNKQQEDLSNEAVMQVGMPAIINFQEKRMMKSIIEARDKTISTTTYVMAQNTGQMFKLCDSVGYGLPYATQYTNPMKTVGYYDRALTSIPQADPNGLFSPSSAEGTWVFCLDPATKKDKPVYVESLVIVSPFPIALMPVEFAKP